MIIISSSRLILFLIPLAIKFNDSVAPEVKIISSELTFNKSATNCLDLFIFVCKLYVNNESVLCGLHENFS